MAYLPWSVGGLLLAATVPILASCAVLREAAAAPLELFGGHQAAVDLGLRDPDSRSYAAILDDAKVSIPRSDSFRIICSGAAEIWYQAHLLQVPAPLRAAMLLAPASPGPAAAALQPRP